MSHTTEALGHSFGEWEIVTAPTCAEAGLRQRICARCGETETETIPATGAHTEPETGVIENEVAATCTAGGSYEEVKYCAVCGEELSRVSHTTEALGHSFGAWETITEPDCTETGLRQRVCARCGEIETEVIAAKGHTPITEPAIAPTCTESGWTEHIYCAVCEEVLEPYQTEIPALGHDWGAWETVTEATCAEAGLRQRICARCGETETETIPATGAHTEPAEPVIENEVAATCTTGGSYDEVKYCAVCGQELSRRTAVSFELGHSFGAWETVEEATCAEEGQRQRVCGRCGETETEVIPATGAHTEPEAGVTENEVPATCTEGGSYEEVKYCTVCGEELSRETHTTEALGHDWGAWETVEEATCAAEGERKRECGRCGETETEAIPATGAHTEPEAGVIENENPATCTEGGSYEEVKYCAVCGEELSRVAHTTEALGHDWSEWETVEEATCTETGLRKRECGRCGEVETETVAAKGHTPITEAGIAPTCTESGWTEHIYCGVCEEVLEPYQTEIPALGHDWGEWETVEEATCGVEGLRRRACGRCGETEEQAIPATGAHITPEEPAVENEKDATCTADGSYELVLYCAVCGEELAREPHVVEAPGHSWGEWETVEEATCTKTGLRRHVCGVCGEAGTETVPAAGHSPVEVETPTCTEAGYQGRTVCAVCGALLTAGTPAPALGGEHAFEAVGEPFASSYVTAGGITMIQQLQQMVCSICGYGYTEVIDEWEEGAHAIYGPD